MLADGKLVRAARGQVKLKEAFQFVVQRELAGGTDTANNEMTDEEVQANKALFEKARADLAETEVAIENMSLIPRRELGGFMVDQMVKFKRELLALSRVLPSACYGMTEAEITAELTSRLHKVYEERLEESEIDALIELLVSLK